MNPQRRPDYYEAILQLRPYDDEVLGFVLDQIEKSPGASIAKKVEYKNGLDLYLSSNALAKNLGQKLKKKFKGELKLSRAIYSTDRQTSKILYRLTVLFRLKK